jgi:cell division protein FtsB
VSRQREHQSLRSVGPLLVAGEVLVLLLLAIAGASSYRDLSAARERESSLTREIGAARERIAALESRIERLRVDPLLLERLAREELGLVRPDDIVILLPREEAPGDGGRSFTP